MQVGDKVTIGDEFYSYTLRDPREPDVIRYVGSTSRPSQRVPALVVASYYGLIDWSSVWSSVVELVPVKVEWK